jgi:ribosomal protein S18 acetylase RimI-like enzyme
MTGIIRLAAADVNERVEELASLLLDAIDSGASVTFLPGLTPEGARNYWLAQAAASDGRAMIAAIDAQGVCGFVQVIPVPMANQPHRAEVSKLLVHRRSRRQGLAEMLMREAEAAARDMGRSHLVLDTAKGDDAERLYTRLGWNRVGEIPDFAYDPAGTLRTTIVFWKQA